MENENDGWIYILSEYEGSDVLKIGMTTRTVEERVRELNSATGVLIPLQVRAKFRVKNPLDTEQAIFKILTERRIRRDREFFNIPLDDAKSIIDAYLKKTSGMRDRPIVAEITDFGCFVATAVYENPSHPQVLRLRNFRDNTLANHLYGRLFIKIYVWIGPRIAKPVNSSAFLRRLFKRAFDRALR